MIGPGSALRGLLACSPAFLGTVRIGPGLQPRLAGLKVLPACVGLPANYRTSLHLVVMSRWAAHPMTMASMAVLTWEDKEGRRIDSEYRWFRAEGKRQIH